MKWWKLLSGLYFIEIVCADPAHTLTIINNSGITLLEMVYVDDLHIRGCVYKKDFKSLHYLLSQRGEDLKILKKKGAYWLLQNLRRRPALVLGMIALFIIALYLPTRVLFVKVEGNQSVPSRLIEEKAQQCGIFFGASRRAVRSESTKNALLSIIPELQWTGVNTYGCVAVITVEERSNNNLNLQKSGVSSIVAARDGIICDIITQKGNLLCRVGQAVRKDQVLVSGYTDCGISIKAERAEAEIKALTSRQMEVITPIEYSIRSDSVQAENRFSLRFGKKIIKLWKDSGISDATCVKIYNEYSLMLPGGFCLPISIMHETMFYYNCIDTKAMDINQFQWVEPRSVQYLYQSMVAGKIVNATVSSDIYDAFFAQSGQYLCEEIISKSKNEGIIQSNGKESGESR